MAETTAFIEKPRTVRGKRLKAAGYQIVREVRTRKVYGRDFDGTVTCAGEFRSGRWYEVITPGEHGTPALVGYQHSRCIHVFYSFAGTASGGDETRALYGGLGDVIDDDAGLRAYERFVRSAPDSLTRKYEGLYRAI